MSTTRYTPKEWKGRLGTGINKYIISPMDETGKQTITSAPDTITQEGDALSSTNLNAFEQRIKNEFDVVCDAIDDIEDGTTIVEKAKKDEDGNNIKATYATKTALSEEETARETADTNEQSARIAKDNDLQSQIVNVNKEVETLDAIVGGEAEVDHIDPAEGQSIMARSRLISYPNLLPNGKFERVGARAVAWNQQGEMINWTKTGMEGTVNYTERKITFTASESGNRTLQLYKYQSPSTSPLKVGEKWIMRAKIYSSTAKNITFRCYPFTADTFSFNAGETKVLTVFIPVNDSTSAREIGIVCTANYTIGDVISIEDFILCNLSSMGEYDSSKTTQQIIDSFNAKFPASYYPQDTGHIYDLNPSGFRIREVNLWDEGTELGWIDGSGQESADTTRLRMKNYMSCNPNTTYYVKMPSDKGMFLPRWYDANQNFIEYTSAVNNGTMTSPSGAFYLRGCLQNAYGTTYNHDIQICLNSLPDAIKTVYHPYNGQTINTPQIADGHYVNKNCYDYVENVTEDGIVKGKFHNVVGSVTYDGSNDEGWSLYGTNTFYIVPSVAFKGTSGNLLANLTCNRLVNVRRYDFANAMEICTESNYFLIKLPSTVTDIATLRTWLASNPLVIDYEFVTESVTDCEPLRSFDISDYSTVEPITPQDELVNRIDVPFSVLTKSNNGIIQQITTNKENIDKHTSILSNHNKRLRNLEHKSGDYEEMIYPDEDYGMDNVPPGVEEYAVVEGLRGVSRVKNQLSGIADGTSGTGNTVDTHYHTFQYSHCYLLAVKATFPSQPTSGGGSGAANSPIFIGFWNDLLTSYKRHPFAYQSNGYYAWVGNATSLEGALADGSTAKIVLQTFPNSGELCTFKDVIVRDLSVYFGTSDLSFLGATDSAKLATIQRDYSYLLEPSDCGTETVNSVYSGFRSKSRNLWDEQSQGGYYNASGVLVNRTDQLCTVNRISIKPNTAYYYKSPNPSQGNFCFYDAEGTFISRVDSTATFTSPSNAYFMQMSFGQQYGAAYNHDICINVSDSQNGTYTPYQTDTLTLPTPVELRSAGSVSDTDELNVEVEVDGQKVNRRRYTERVGVYNVTGNEGWSVVGSGTELRAFIVRPNTWGKFNGLSNNFVYGSAQNIGGIDIGDGYVRINIYGKATTDAEVATWLQNHPTVIYYPLAEESVTLSDPILDPLIKVEPNGTIEAIQSQETKIDGSMVVGYMYQ